jgi:alpha-N-arabinofuranosidase
VIPETLFGSFLEPIGHSTYGGLWADVVENPSFENGLWSVRNEESMLRSRPELRRASQLGLPLPWEPLDGSQGNRYLPVRGDAANSNQSILIMSLPGKEVGVLQRVYLPVQRELAFNGSLWVKHIRGPVGVEISLRRHAHADKTLASSTVQAAATEWTKYTFTLTLQPGQLAPLEPADLAISISDDGRAEIDNVSLSPADAVDGMDPDVLAMARKLKSPLVRFGGNFTSSYHWQDGIGPMDRRVSVLNASWGIPEYNTFGTDEFLRFCKAIQAQPQVALNLGTGSPEEAASWVRYINDHWNNGQGGLLWELGNELWGDFQIGYPSQERIAAVTLASSKAVREVDPHARLIATGGDEDFFTGWNAQQLTNPPSTFEFLSTHFVVTDAVQLPHATADFRTMAALALPWGLSEWMHAIQKQAVELGHPDSRVAFTEWLMVSDTHTAPHFTNLGGALFAGGFLNMAMRNSDVVSISDMTGIVEFGGIWKKREQVYGAPAYWVLREYARTKPHWLMDVVSDTPTYSIAHGINRLPEIKNVPYLDCSAAEAEPKDSLILTCVNRHLTRPLEAEIDLRAFSISPGTANATTIAGESILSENDEEEPSRVAPVSHSISFQRGKPLHYTFPNASVTVIRIPLKP